MDSITIIGTIVQTQTLTSCSKNQGRFKQMVLTESLGPVLFSIACYLSKLKAETHFVAKLGCDLAAIDAQRTLEKHGCFVYGPTLDLPTPYEYFIHEQEHEERFSTISEDFFFHKQDWLYQSALSHCSWGLTDQKDQAYLQALFSAFQNTPWIYYTTTFEKPPCPCFSGLILDEIDSKTLCTLKQSLPCWIDQGLSWAIVLQKQEGITLFADQTIYDFSLSQTASSLTSGPEKAALLALFLYALLQKQSLKTAVEFALQAVPFLLKEPLNQEKIQSLLKK